MVRWAGNAVVVCRREEWRGGQGRGKLSQCGRKKRVAVGVRDPEGMSDPQAMGMGDERWLAHRPSASLT